MSDKPRERSAPATGPPPGGSAGGPRGCDRGGYAGAVRRGGGATGGQPPVGHGLGTLAAAFVPPAYNYLVGTSPVPVPGMSQQAHERERLLEEARLQMAWGIEVLHQQYYERVQQIYASMPVGGSGLSSSLMTQVGTGAVPVAGPRGCVPPAPRGRVHSLCHLLLGSRVGQPRGGKNLFDRWGEHPCGTARTPDSRWWGVGGMGLRVLDQLRPVGRLGPGSLVLRHLARVCPGRDLTRVRTCGLGRVVRRGRGRRTQRRGSATGRLIQSGRLVQGRLVAGVVPSKRGATTAIRRGTVLASVPSDPHSRPRRCQPCLPWRPLG